MENSVLATLCFVLNNHFFEELILLAFLADLSGLVIAVEIVEVDFVTVLVFKGVEAPV